MKKLLLMLLALSFSPSVQAAEPAVDFRDFKGQDAKAFLKKHNFIFERKADDSRKTKLTFTDKGLEIEALARAQSFLALKKGHLSNYRDVVIKWGVNKFPRGASYAKGKRNEAIMLYAFFGTEMIGSGGLIVPDSPYFIALHLCENDEINKPEKGRYYHKGGRFVCVAKPKPGELVTTRFDLKQAFQEYFGFPAPPLHGIAFEFDTNGAPDGGKTSAFVQSIEFPAATYNVND